MKIEFSSQAITAKDVMVLFCSDGGKLGELASRVDKQLKGAVSRAIKSVGFEGKRESLLTALAPAPGVDCILVVGLGNKSSLAAREAEMLGGVIAGAMAAGKRKAAQVLAELNAKNGLSEGEFASLLASGATLRTYAFEKYKTKGVSGFRLPSSLTIHTAAAADARKGFAALQAVAEGVHMARDLVNEPANVLTPIEFAKRARTLSRYGVKLEILESAQMKRLGMGALLGVAQGSVNPPRLVIMRWNGAAAGAQPVAFIGKGVTFDTGGVSIKPAAGMEDMKGDMAGAACVTGLMLALAKRKAKVNAIGAIGLVENAVDGAAQRPGDVVTSMSGQTIAVLNTDAEGRLVLADVLWYVQKRFKPRFMVDLATLTGAILVALGKEHAGLFSNNDELAQRLVSAGSETGEKVWRMPLAPEYDKIIDHDVADVKNTGGRNAGSITAAQFLQRFVNSVPWAHLDVAGTAMDSPKSAINQSWASGWGVRLLDRLVRSHYER